MEKDCKREVESLRHDLTRMKTTSDNKNSMILKEENKEIGPKDEIIK